MARLTHRFAEGGDLPLLAATNAELIADEGSDNPMTQAELEARMAGLLRGEYAAALFDRSHATVGYGLWRPAERGVHLRQFMIRRMHRRAGFGRQAIALLR